MKEDLSMTAAEYVLGTLSTEERASFARQIETDPQARAALEEWESRLAPMNGVVESLTPSPETWRGVTRRLGFSDAEGARVVVLRQAVTRWRIATGAAVAMAASLAVFVIARPEGGPAPGPQRTAQAEPPAQQAASSALPRKEIAAASQTGAANPSSVVAASASREDGGVVALGGNRPQEIAAAGGKPTYFAALAPAGVAPGLVARLEPGTRTLIVRRIAAAQPADKVLELWIVAQGGEPRPLGRIDRETSRLTIPADVPLEGATIIASVERADAPPPARPSAPIYQGALVKD